MTAAQKKEELEEEGLRNGQVTYSYPAFTNLFLSRDKKCGFLMKLEDHMMILSFRIIMFFITTFWTH